MHESSHRRHSAASPHLCLRRFLFDTQLNIIEVHLSATRPSQFLASPNATDQRLACLRSCTLGVARRRCPLTSLVLWSQLAAYQARCMRERVLYYAACPGKQPLDSWRSRPAEGCNACSTYITFRYWFYTCIEPFYFFETALVSTIWGHTLLPGARHQLPWRRAKALMLALTICLQLPYRASCAT